MPLVKSKSKKAFQENVKKELASGRPLKQSLAIAYSVKRAAEGRKASAKGRPANRSMKMTRRKTK